MSINESSESWRHGGGIALLEMEIAWNNRNMEVILELLLLSSYSLSPVPLIDPTNDRQPG